MRFLPLIFLPLITTLLIACPFDSTRNKPMLKYNPAEFYDGPALKMAEVIRNRDHAVLPTLVISQIQWVNSTGQKGCPLLAWTMGHDDLVAAEILLKAARLALKAYVQPSIESEVHPSLKEIADEALASKGQLTKEQINAILKTHSVCRAVDYK